MPRKRNTFSMPTDSEDSEAELEQVNYTLRTALTRLTREKELTIQRALEANNAIAIQLTMADIWLKAKDDLLLDMESRIGLMSLIFHLYPGYYYPDDEPAALSKTVERLGNVLQHLQNKHNADLNVATEEGQTRNHDDLEIDEMKCDKCGAHWTQSIQDFNESPGNSQAGSSQGQIKYLLKGIEDSHSKMLQARIWEPKAIRSDQDKQELEKITENQAGQLKTAYRELHDATAMQVTPRISEQATQTLSDPLDDLQVQTLSDPADDLQTQLQQSLDKADATLATLRIENNTLQAEVNETRSCKLRMQQSLEETCDSNTKMLQQLTNSSHFTQELESVKIDLKSTYERKQELEQTTADQVAAHEELRKVMAMQLEQLETIKIDLETTRRQKEEFEHPINDQAGKLEAASQELRKAQMSEQAIQTQLDPPFLSSEDCLELVIRRDELFKCREHCLQLEQSALEATSKYESQQLIQTKIRQAELQIHQNIIRLLEGILNQSAAPSEFIPNREQPLYPLNRTHVLRVSLSSSASGLPGFAACVTLGSSYRGDGAVVSFGMKGDGGGDMYGFVNSP
ncbi:hypothetical protein FB446DRAFT_708946 [Lentinula raphanica]|nr:hypothetical protein FB446DRAFT_708946 [Lentinula raphanica]